MEHEESISLTLMLKAQPAHQFVEVRLDLYESDDAFRIDLQWPGRDVLSVTAGSYFHALQNLRVMLSAEGACLCCQGARVNVYPSGMSLEMNGGRLAYQMTMGQQARNSDVVDIFSPSEDCDQSTVEEQNRFRERWFKSLAS